jgi:hypothetical protein
LEKQGKLEEQIKRLRKEMADNIGKGENADNLNSEKII